MAFTTSIDDSRILLFDRVPGGVQGIGERLRRSTGGLTLTNPDFFNVAYPAFEPWTKIQVRDESLGGFCTFVYAKVGSQDSTHTIAARIILGLEVSGNALSGFLSNDGGNSRVVLGGPAFIALGAVTTGNWAWFQCGGRPAVGLVDDLDGSYAADGNVTAGKTMSLVVNDNAIAFGVGAAGYEACGVASGADV